MTWDIVITYDGYFKQLAIEHTIHKFIFVACGFTAGCSHPLSVKWSHTKKKKKTFLILIMIILNCQMVHIQLLWSLSAGEENVYISGQNDKHLPLTMHYCWKGLQRSKGVLNSGSGMTSGPLPDQLKVNCYTALINPKSSSCVRRVFVRKWL